MAEQSNLIREEKLGVIRPNPVMCKTCRFSHGKSSFTDQPEKAYCMIYTRIMVFRNHLGFYMMVKTSSIMKKYERGCDKCL